MLAITSGIPVSDIWVNGLGRRILLVPQPYRSANSSCGRPRGKDGQPCMLFRATEPWGQCVAPACTWHLTADERADWKVHLAKREAFRQTEDSADEPDCWSWPISQKIRDRLVADDWKEREDAFFDWHAGAVPYAGCGQATTSLRTTRIRPA